MRKHLLFILLAVLCCNGLFAQDEIEDTDRRFRIAIGPKVGFGVGLGSRSKLEDISFSPALSFQAGAAINAHFGRRYEMSDGGTGWLGLQLEALYGKRAVKLGGKTLGVNDIEVPVLAQLYFIPSMAFELGGTYVKVLSCTPNQLSYHGATYGTGKIKGNDVMITAGLCYKARFGLMLDLRYNLSTSNLAGNFDTKVSSVMFSLSYLFKIVK